MAPSRYFLFFLLNVLQLFAGLNAQCTANQVQLNRYHKVKSGSILNGIPEDGTEDHWVTTLAAAPAGYTLETQLGYVLTTPTGCTCQLVQLKTFKYSQTTFPKIDNTIVTTGDSVADAFFNYYKDQSTPMYCVDPSQPAGTCGATVELWRYYNLLNVDHVLGVVNDPIQASGYLLEPQFLRQCWIWTAPVAATTTAAAATVASTSTSCATGALPANSAALHRYRKPKTGSIQQGVPEDGTEDHLMSTITPAPNGYTLQSTLGYVLTSPVGSTCQLIQLKTFKFSQATFPKVENTIVANGDPGADAFFNYYEDFSTPMYCVDPSQPAGTCGATIELYRYYNWINIDHALGEPFDSYLLQNLYAPEPQFLRQCWIWAEPSCTASTLAAPPAPICTGTTPANMAELFRYHQPATGNFMELGVEDTWTTTSAGAPAGYALQKSLGYLLTSPTGTTCQLIQLKTFKHIRTTFPKVTNTLVATGDALADAFFDYYEDFSTPMYCVDPSLPAGSCGATVELYRWYNWIKVDHALGPLDDTQLIGQSLPEAQYLRQCWIWATPCVTA